MRISCRRGDPFFDESAVLYKPLLNGVELRQCFMADEEKGEAHCYIENDNGELYMDGEEIAWEVKKGTVKLIKR
jgi:hypothetical protein